MSSFMRDVMIRKLTDVAPVVTKRPDCGANARPEDRCVMTYPAKIPDLGTGSGNHHHEPSAGVCEGGESSFCGGLVN